MGATLTEPAERGHPGSIIPITGPVGFIGMGKVGTALASLLRSRGVDIAGVSGRDIASARHMAHEAGLDRASALPRSDTVAASGIVFLTVPDDAIGPLCEEVAANEGWAKGQFVVHCSGALTSDILAPAREQGALVASFHPLQAFADVQAAIANMPGSAFGIEGDAPVVDVLARFAELLGGRPLHLTPEQKTLYHAAATIASNYTVTLAALASGLLVQAGIAPDPDAALGYLLPLLRGTVQNLGDLGLPAALTGALARGDIGTVECHIQALESVNPSLARLYRDLARATLTIAAQKGQLDQATVARFEELLSSDVKCAP